MFPKWKKCLKMSFFWLLFRVKMTLINSANVYITEKKKKSDSVVHIYQSTSPMHLHSFKSHRPFSKFSKIQNNSIPITFKQL